MKRTPNVLVIAIVLGVTTTCSARPASQPASKPASQPSSQAASDAAAIRRIDFKNFTFDLGGGQTKTFVKGVHSPCAGPANEDADHEDISQVEYADVVGNGGLQALVTIQSHMACEGGDCGGTRWLLLSMRNSRPAVLWNQEGQDDSHFGMGDDTHVVVDQVTIHPGLLVIYRFDYAKSRKNKKYKSERAFYRVSPDGKLTQLKGAEERRVATEFSEREREAAKNARATAKAKKPPKATKKGRR